MALYLIIYYSISQIISQANHFDFYAAVLPLFFAVAQYLPSACFGSIYKL